MKHRPLNEALADVGERLSVDDSFGPAESAAVAEDQRCGVLVRVSPELRRRLKLTAIERGSTIQNLLLQAIAVVLDSRPEPPAH